MSPLLNAAVTLSLDKIRYLSPNDSATITYADSPVLIVLAAGKGTRFGTEPKCVQPIGGIPLARCSILQFRQVSAGTAVCIVGYRHEQVAAALGEENVFVLSENPAGGTGFATFEAFCVPELLEQNPLVVITMGDRIVPAQVYRALWNAHCDFTAENAEGEEAALTLLTALYDPPRNQDKGRILRDGAGKIVTIREQKDIDAESDTALRTQLSALTEGNCPLYMVRARLLYELLGQLTNDNAQKQFYLTDIVDTIIGQGGEIRSITTQPGEQFYELLCADVTHADDLAKLEQIVAKSTDLI